jgi:putative exporter of polyketide antibiotics
MSTLVGTGKLVRLILRRDRWLLALWIPFFCLVLLSYARTLGDIFPTPAERLQYADNGGFVALYGPLSGTSLGEFVTWRAGFLPVLVALVGLLTVIRHTRTDEEAGRRELLGAGVVGRHAPLAAALAATLGASLVLAAAVALAMTGQHLPAAGSLALGAELAAACVVFAAVGGLAAQLTQSAATARGIAVGALGATWLLRVAGDLSDHTGGSLGWLSWLSPLAWAQRIRPYGGDRWWLLAPAAGLVAVLAVAALALSGRRDVGAACCRPAPARPPPPPACAAPWPWPGGCTGACWPAGRPGSPRWGPSSAAWPTGSGTCSAATRPCRTSSPAWVAAPRWSTPTWPPS